METAKITLTNAEEPKKKTWQLFIYLVFAVYGLAMWFLKDDSIMLALGLGHILFFIFYIFLRSNQNYYEFTQEGIYEPAQWKFSKRTFLAYDDIEEAVYVVGDYVFRNKKTEFRLPKELLKEEDVDYLEDKLKDLKDTILDKSNLTSA